MGSEDTDIPPGPLKGQHLYAFPFPPVGSQRTENSLKPNRGNEGQKAASVRSAGACTTSSDEHPGMSIKSPD